MSTAVSRNLASALLACAILAASPSCADDTDAGDDSGNLAADLGSGADLARDTAQELDADIDRGDTEPDLAPDVVLDDQGLADAADLAGADTSMGADAADAADADANADADADADAGPLATRDAGESVKAPGPFGVGYVEREVSYVPAGAEGPRTLPLAVWYPTRAESGPLAVYQGWIRRGGVIRDAPIVGGRSFPLMVFSHGNGGFAEQSMFLTEFLASHGWVVVSPDHTGNTLANMSIPIERMLDLRPQDVIAVLDATLAEDADHPAAGRLSGDVVVAGHSFGGYTTMAVTGAPFDIGALDAECPELAATPACLYYRESGARERFLAGYRDERFDVAVAFTPAGNGFFDLEDLGAIEVPFLLATGALDATTPNLTQGDPIWEGLVGDDKLRIDLDEGGHFTYSNACDLVPNLGDGCGPAYLPPAEAYPAINAFVLAFLRLHLWDDRSEVGILEGTDVVLEGVEISRKVD